MPEPTPAQIGAFDAGQVAYSTGQPSTTCPFRNDSIDDVGDLRTLWIRGWVLARTEHLYGNVEVPPTGAQRMARQRWRLDRPV